MWAPKSGWYVPTQDGVFHEGTMIHFETTDSKDEAVKAWEKAGLDADYTSYFYRPSDYKDRDRFVGRGFGPSLDGHGRFGVYAGRLPSVSGDDRVASRPKYEVAMKITAILK